MYNCNNDKTIFSRGGRGANGIHHSNSIYNYFKSLKLGLFLSDVYLNHLMTIMVSVFLRGYRGKTIDFAKSAADTEQQLPISWIMANGTTLHFKISWKPVWYRQFTRRCIAPETPFSVSWMIPLLHMQSPRHRLYIQLKQRISISPT